MFNSDLKNKAIDRLKQAENGYNEIVSVVQEKAKNLFEYRMSISKDLISSCEEYINLLANSPKEFEKSVNLLSISFKDFETTLRNVVQHDNCAKVSGGTALGGIAAATGVAAFAPTAAMAIATTFGTASTGVAISTLSGAAATKAALAWIGGGAIATGGGGMAAGSAILALAGPIGWTIGGASLLGSSIWAWKKNKKIAEKATEAAIQIETAKTALETSNREVAELIHLTRKHSEGVLFQLSYLYDNAPKDYSEFDDQCKSELGALINNINSLSKLIKKKIGE